MMDTNLLRSSLHAGVSNQPIVLLHPANALRPTASRFCQMPVRILGGISCGMSVLSDVRRLKRKRTGS